MNLVDGAMTFPVPVGNDASLARSEDAVRCMEAVGWGDLAVVVARNLSMTRSLRVVDALLLVLHVQEVRNFESWEQARVAKEVPVQDHVRVFNLYPINPDRLSNQCHIMPVFS